MTTYNTPSSTPLVGGDYYRLVAAVASGWATFGLQRPDILNSVWNAWNYALSFPVSPAPPLGATTATYDVRVAQAAKGKTVADLVASVNDALSVWGYVVSVVKLSGPQAVSSSTAPAARQQAAQDAANTGAGTSVDQQLGGAAGKVVSGVANAVGGASKLAIAIAVLGGVVLVFAFLPELKTAAKAAT